LKIKKQSAENTTAGIVASLEGMKIRSDREALLHLTAFPKLLILGERDPVLPHEETKTR
jgi:hypothetical protein